MTDSSHAASTSCRSVTADPSPRAWRLVVAAGAAGAAYYLVRTTTIIEPRVALAIFVAIFLIALLLNATLPRQ